MSRLQHFSQSQCFLLHPSRFARFQAVLERVSHIHALRHNQESTYKPQWTPADQIKSTLITINQPTHALSSLPKTAQESAKNGRVHIAATPRLSNPPSQVLRGSLQRRLQRSPYDQGHAQTRLQRLQCPRSRLSLENEGAGGADGAMHVLAP